MIRRMLRDLESQYRNLECKIALGNDEVKAKDKTRNIVVPQAQCESLVPGAKTKVYRPLFSRPTCGKCTVVLSYTKIIGKLIVAELLFLIIEYRIKKTKSLFVSTRIVKHPVWLCSTCF